jgi:hypothetical protein
MNIVQKRRESSQISGGLADAELGFDAGDAIVDINDSACKGVELDVQTVEACFKPVESRIHGVPLNHVIEDSGQHLKRCDVSLVSA